MKPVIKKQTHYNLLLVKDDSEAKTFRLHGSLLRFLLCLFLLLILGGAAGIAGGVYYWEKYRSLHARYGNLDGEAAEMRLQLERLINLECLIAASNSTAPALQARNEEVGAVPRQMNSTSPVTATADATASLPGGANATSRTPSAADAGDTLPATPGGQDAVAAGAALPETLPANDASANASSPSFPTKEPLLSLESEASPLRIAGFQARPGGSQRVRLSYELSATNPEEMRNISGSTRYEAVFGNGTRLDLPFQDIDGARFSIFRMKPMQSSARLQPGYSVEDITTIEVYVDTSDGRVFHQSFPFTR